MKTKMKDIARKAGVSITTISRVINNSGYVAEGTKEKISKIIQDNNYSLNGIAQSLRTKKTYTIGFVMDQIYPDAFQASVAMWLETEAKKHNYKLLISNDLGIEKNEDISVNLLVKYRVDGIIFGFLRNKKNVSKIKKFDIPVVLVERTKGLKNTSAVLLDYRAGIKNAVEYLFSRGTKKIGFIGANPGDNIGDDCFDSYRESLNKTGLEYNSSYIYLGPLDFETGFKAVEKNVNNNIFLDALIIVGNLTAMGAVQACYKYKIKIPEDIMIITTDDVMAQYTTPPLTSVSYDEKEIARTAFTLIFEQFGKKRPKNRIVFLEPKLNKRISTND